MQTEIELLRAITENLYTAVLGDVLDLLGHTHQFLPQPIQPMKESMRLVGRAMPVQIADTWSQQKDPFGLMTEALDQLLPGEVYVATGGSQSCAAWGEILTATARVRGAVGAVIDGYHRDTVLAVPRAIEEEAVARALEKARGEKVIRKAIEAGCSSTEAFRKYGIL